VVSGLRRWPPRTRGIRFRARACRRVETAAVSGGSWRIYNLAGIGEPIGEVWAEGRHRDMSDSGMFTVATPKGLRQQYAPDWQGERFH
jgi:hypothetical protein